MKEMGERLRTLRDGIKISQAKLAAICGTNQSAINRYETGQSTPPLKTLIWYADYFDVSMDYLFARADNPQGKLYNYQPEVLRERMSDKQDWERFVEMCFDPDSPMSTRLKDALMQMVDNGK